MYVAGHRRTSPRRLPRAIFFKGESELELAFDTAIQDINYLNPEYQLEFNPIKRYLSEDDSIILQEMACDLLNNGVAAIIGPSSATKSDIVNVLCNLTGIPHLQFDWNGEETDMVQSKYFYTINVAPSVNVLSQAYLDIVKNNPLNWKTFTIAYETSSDLSRMQHLLAWKQFHKSGIKLIPFNRNDDLRILWKLIKNSRERNVLIDCPADMAVGVMQEAINFNMTTSFNSFFFTNLDTHTSGLQSLISDKFLSNVTSVRLRSYIPPPQHSETDVFDPGEKDSIRSLKQQNIYDVLVLYYNALQQTFQPDPIPPPEGSCMGGFWESGNDVIDRMKKMNSKHIEPHYKTQKMLLNPHGIRDDFNLDIYDAMIDETLSVWNKNHGLVPYDHLIANMTRKPVKPRKKGDDAEKQKKKVKYTVATRIGEPYFMIREEPEGVHFEGNDRFKGYVVDLIFELSKDLHFDFVFEPVPDNKYGSYDPVTNEWDGIVRQLMDNQAQMGICDLTITQERRTVVDFTVPFMQLGVQILYSKPPPPKKELFQFLEPFSVEVWLCLLIALLLMSLIYVLLARFTPEEWQPQDDPNSVQLVWSLRNSLHLHINSVLQVGCDILPTANHMRLFTTFWWIFALLMAQTYLAKMTSFITASKMDGTIQNLHDLVQQNKIQFGTIKGGSTSQFFSESNESEYRLAWNKMRTFKPEALTKDNKEGVDRVRHSKGRYAFLLETPNLQYYAKRHCDLMPIGDPFGEKLYGIAVPLNAPYRSELNVGILKLSEQGFLYKLKREWIFNNNTVLCEDEHSGSQDGSQMDMETLRGVFLVLQLGIGVALVIGVVEFIWYTYKMAARDRIHPKEALKKDFQFFLRFWIERKPLTMYKRHGSSIQSKGSLLPASTTTATTGSTSTEKQKKKVKRRKRGEQSERE
ncbi:glutamate receptor ionotropic, kainate 2 [Musca vetustissima]|uniref:glutamate receptor ionotropic, kainate 2 n=1 Tax=Musca vetustissima TaxID=27455 RepID=UPI002AB5F0F0|nr:glutamate receptor ionotropic, kainate 2 [Musca vetustissima]